MDIRTVNFVNVKGKRLFYQGTDVTDSVISWRYAYFTL